MSEAQVAEPSTEASPSDWKSTLDPTIAADPSIQHIASVDAMAKSYINAQKMVGAEKIAVPGSWATEEDWNGVYAKLGRPEAPDKYELELPDDANQEFSDWFRNTAHSVGLSTAQAKKLAAAYGEFSGDAQKLTEQQLEAARAESETQLRKEFGKDFDQKLEGAKELLTTLDLPEFTSLKLADGTSIGDNPQLVTMLIKVHDHIQRETSEDTLAGRDSRPGVTAEELQDRISNLTQQGSPYWEKMHPDHARMVEEVLRLREQLHG